MTVAIDVRRPDLKQTLAETQLAALPQTAIRLLELSRDPGSGPAEYAAPIEGDPGMAGQVLKFVNSSYFGFARKISSVKEGISLVGAATIKNFALWNAVFSLVPNPRCGPFDLKSIWQDSLRRALFARAVAKARRLKTAEEIFTAALLQDMAVPVLAQALPQVYVKLLEARNQGQHRLSALENDSFGWTHGHAAGQLARQWNLSEDFAALLEYHVDGVEAHNAGDAAGCGIVALSALLPATADPVWVERADWEAECSRFCPEAGSPAELLGRVDREFTEIAPVLKLAAPRRSLVDLFLNVSEPFGAVWRN